MLQLKLENVINIHIYYYNNVYIYMEQNVIVS